MLKVLQIVKRFGPVGGMERYVWELSHALANQNIEVHILCEQTFQPAKHKNIHTHCIGKIFPKPRWWSMLRFSHKVEKWIKNNISADFVIHSHERTNVHHVTTFHASLFAKVRQKVWWKKISVRIAVWLYLEKREVCGNQVKIVLPNSDLIHHELDKMYPCIGENLYKPAYPGIHLNKTIAANRIKPENEIIIFIGQEWKRKGLEKAIQIVKAIKIIKPTLEFWVLGPEAKDIAELFKDWDKGYRLLGWQDSSPYLAKASLLIHPALAEPYGMAIAEANSIGIPVVVSSECGIANLITEKSGQILSTESSTDFWVKACIEELNRTSSVKRISKSWHELAEDHIQIYHKINST